MFQKIMIFLFACIALVSLSACDNLMKESSDTIITSKVLAQYAKDPILDVFQLKVSTSQGAVALSGLVNSGTEAERAIMIAQSTKGVNKVDTTGLKIKEGKTPILDTFITAKIRGLLLQKDIVSGLDVKSWNLSVSTKNQIVYLTGKVSNKTLKDEVIKLAESVNDVKKVKSDIAVK